MSDTVVCLLPEQQQILDQAAQRLVQARASAAEAERALGDLTLVLGGPGARSYIEGGRVVVERAAADVIDEGE